MAPTLLRTSARRIGLTGLLAAALLATACGDSGSSGTSDATTSASASASMSGEMSEGMTHDMSADARGPLTLDQCTGEKQDRQVTYEEIPQKVFTLDPQSAEFLIALGLGDRIVGTWGSYTDEQLETLPQYADELRAIKSYDDGETWPPPIEVIASTKPDIVVTTYRLNIPGYLDATRLKEDAGIDAYSFTSYCTGETMRTLDPVFQDVTNLGQIFGAEAAAADLVETMQGQLAEAAALTEGEPRSTVWQYAGEEVPYPVGGTGVPNAIMYLAGADNVFEDVGEVYAEVSWEQVIERNPEVVWLQTDAGPGFIETEDALRKAIEANPGLAGVDGVAAKRYVVIPYTTAGTLSVHNAEAVLEFAKALREARAS